MAIYEIFMSSSSEPTAFSVPVTVVRPAILHRRNCLRERRPGYSLPAGARMAWATRPVPGRPMLLPPRQLQHRPRPQNAASRAAVLGCCGAALEDGRRNRRLIAFHGLTLSKAVQRLDFTRQNILNPHFTCNIIQLHYRICCTLNKSGDVWR